MKDSRRSRLFLGLLLAAALVLTTVDHQEREHARVRADAHDRHLGVRRGRTRGRHGHRADRRLRRRTRRRAQGSADQITNLKTQNAKLQGELSSQRIDKRRSAELQATLGLAGLEAATRSSWPRSWRRRASPGLEDAVEIDAGTADGSKPDMTVLPTPQGLVAAGGQERPRRPRPWC